MNADLKKITSELLSGTGVEINGSNPWDIQIHRDDFYPRVFKQGSLGLGEAYMDGWWDCEQLDEFFNRIFTANVHQKFKLDPLSFFKVFFLAFFNRQSKRRSLEVGHQHYDLGNHLFKLMLDKRMNYSCGYWKNARDLDEAQRDKLELTCRKLMLKPGMRLLDIGCGFGALSKYAAENFAVEVLGVTISKEQLAYAKENAAGLPIEYRFQDYRDLTGQFDRIVSIGMFEHVGPKNYATYMNVVQRCLKENGLFLLHCIGNNVSGISGDPWITKYIFPNGELPSLSQIGKATEGIFIMEDWHNFGTDYDKTLLAWHSNFINHWPTLKRYYDQRFFRMWNYYLLSTAGSFRSRSTQLWQIVFSPHGIKGGYQRPAA